MDDTGVWRQVFQELVQEVKPWHTWTLTLDKGLLPNVLQPEWRQYQQWSFARFQCSLCSRSWASAQVQVLFHMHWSKKKSRGQVKMKLFGQRCQKCSQSPFEVPEFTQENISRILNNLVLQILKKCYREEFKPIEAIPAIKDNSKKGPHDIGNCEACLQGFCAQAKLDAGQQSPTPPLLPIPSKDVRGPTTPATASKPSGSQPPLNMDKLLKSTVWSERPPLPEATTAPKTSYIFKVPSLPKAITSPETSNISQIPNPPRVTTVPETSCIFKVPSLPKAATAPEIGHISVVCSSPKSSCVPKTSKISTRVHNHPKSVIVPESSHFSVVCRSSKSPRVPETSKTPKAPNALKSAAAAETNDISKVTSLSIATTTPGARNISGPSTAPRLPNFQMPPIRSQIPQIITEMPDSTNRSMQEKERLPLLCEILPPETLGRVTMSRSRLDSTPPPPPPGTGRTLLTSSRFTEPSSTTNLPTSWNSRTNTSCQGEMREQIFPTMEASYSNFSQTPTSRILFTCCCCLILIFVIVVVIIANLRTS